MASNVEAVETLLEELREVSYHAAVRELEQLKAFAQQEDFKHWDMSFWGEKTARSQVCF